MYPTNSHDVLTMWQALLLVLWQKQDIRSLCLHGSHILLGGETRDWWASRCMSPYGSPYEDKQSKCKGLCLINCSLIPYSSKVFLKPASFIRSFFVSLFSLRLFPSLVTQSSFYFELLRNLYHSTLDCSSLYMYFFFTIDCEPIGDKGNVAILNFSTVTHTVPGHG